MKRFMLLLCLASMLLAIEQVPRQDNSKEEKNPPVQLDNGRTSVRTGSRDVRAQDIKVVQRNDREQDRFQDSNSNGVNDRREDDFQSIKTKKSKYKELIDKKKIQETRKKPPETPPRDKREPEKKEK